MMIQGRRRWKAGLLIMIIATLSLATFERVQTVKGLQRPTGFIDSGLGGISMDAGRIAFLSNSTTVTVYDTACDNPPPQTDLSCGVIPRSASFPPPGPVNTTPMIYGDKV